MNEQVKNLKRLNKDWKEFLDKCHPNEDIDPFTAFLHGWHAGNDNGITNTEQSAALQDIDDMPCYCDYCEESFHVDLILPDPIWDRLVGNNTTVLCPKCIGELFNKHHQSRNDFAAYKIIPVDESDKSSETELKTLEQLFNKLGLQLGGRLWMAHSVMDGFQLATYDSSGNRIGASIPQATIRDCVAKFTPTTKGAQG